MPYIQRSRLRDKYNYDLKIFDGVKGRCFIDRR